MAAPLQRTLFESAMQRARIVRHTNIVCIIVDGGGSMVVPTADFVSAQKWAASRIWSGNMLNDRGRVLDRLPIVVSRPGSIVPTRGDPRQLEDLAKSMRAAGYDLNEWSLPADIRNPPRPIDTLASPGAKKKPTP